MSASGIGRLAAEAIADMPPHLRPAVRGLVASLLGAGASDGTVASAIRRGAAEPKPRPPIADPTDQSDLLTDYRTGMAVVLGRAIIPAWWTAPGDRAYPPLPVGQEMGKATAELLGWAELPGRVAREAARRRPPWRALMPELVWEIARPAQEVAR